MRYVLEVNPPRGRADPLRRFQTTRAGSASFGPSRIASQLSGLQ
jgi:hypothetical protein